MLSASYEPSLKKQCDALGLTPYMRDISGLQDESASKKTEIGGGSCMNWGWLARTWCLWAICWRDAHLAEALGADCVLVSWGHNDLKRLMSTGLPVAHSFEKLEEILKRF